MPEARVSETSGARYRAFKERHPDRKPLFYDGRDTWTPIPKSVSIGSLPSPERRGANGLRVGAKCEAGMMTRGEEGPARLQSEREVQCPCCGRGCSSSTSISAASSPTASHRSGLNIELSDAQRILADEKARREAAFEQSFNTERTKGDALSRRFEEALKQAKEEPITKPTRDFDLD